MNELTYDDATHTYFWNGKKIPSVNQILEKVGVKKKYDGDPYYGEIGTCAAKAIELYLKGTLDEESIDEAIRPRFEAFRRFEKENCYQPIQCEGLVGNELFAGRFDHHGTIKGINVLLDTKCTERVDDYGTDCQLSGYWELLEEKPQKKAALRLGKDGTYDLIYYPFPAEKLWGAVWTLFQRKTDK